MDYFTRKVEIYATPNRETTTVADVMLRNFSRFEVLYNCNQTKAVTLAASFPATYVTCIGCGKERFERSEIRTIALYTQSNGMVERMNRIIRRYVSKVVCNHQKDWDKQLVFFLIAYRSIVNKSTEHASKIKLSCDRLFGYKPREDLAAADLGWMIFTRRFNLVSRMLVIA